jgi:hypothetical protein
MAKYRWKPIEDLPANWQSMASDEISRLLDVWKALKAELEG